MMGGGKEAYAVPIHEDGSVLRAKYLHDLEGSVKARTPISGDGITIVRTDGGSTIKIANAATCQILEFNVCSNGTPDKIAILCVVTKSGYNSLYDTNVKVSFAPITTIA